jgi:hypothetical protein
MRQLFQSPKMFIQTIAFVGAICSYSGASPDTIAASRDAKCLLEVAGTHYIGDVCKYIEIDKLGSFRVLGGLDLIAQVNVVKKGEGQASWNGPLGTGAGKSLGAAYQASACWSGGGSGTTPRDDFLICAWSMSTDVYLGPSPPAPDSSDAIYWGSRVGMYDNIGVRKGIDTSNAVIKTAPSREGVIQFCRECESDYSNKCIEKGLGDDVAKTITANCLSNTFYDFYSRKFAFLGKNRDTNGDVTADYLIKDLKSGQLLDGTSASGYDVAFGIFKALCPLKVPH